mmetsp:Transcript_24100/g.54397  ORF Transcript_24100/g.54397 Transcript_24100/m.54397 type:complete len:276 (+) Transcript_24100:949-1776(+)
MGQRRRAGHVPAVGHRARPPEPPQLEGRVGGLRQGVGKGGRAVHRQGFGASGPSAECAPGPLQDGVRAPAAEHLDGQGHGGGHVGALGRPRRLRGPRRAQEQARVPQEVWAHRRNGDALRGGPDHQHHGAPLDGGARGVELRHGGRLVEREAGHQVDQGPRQARRGQAQDLQHGLLLRANARREIQGREGVDREAQGEDGHGGGGRGAHLLRARGVRQVADGRGVRRGHDRPVVPQVRRGKVEGPGVGARERPFEVHPVLAGDFGPLQLHPGLAV